MVRRDFYQEEIQLIMEEEAVKEMGGLIRSIYPTHFQALLRTYGHRDTIKSIESKGWSDEKGSLEFVRGLVLQHYVLGPDLATQLIYEGQHQTLTSMGFAVEHVLDERNGAYKVDLQTVLLLTIVNALAKSQTAQDPTEYLVSLLEELDLEKRV